MMFEKPLHEYGFYGVPNRSNVYVMPTSNCLISISEMPFFVTNLVGIDIAVFERVFFGSKSFDLVLIEKDLVAWKRISGIPVENLEPLKDLLDQKNILFS